MRKASLLIALVLAPRAALAQEPPTAAPASADARVETLERQVAALESRERERDERDAALVERVRGMIRIGGFAQLNWAAMRQSSVDEINGSNGEPLNQNRFVLRRARLRAEGEHGVIAGALELDANTVRAPQFRATGAEVSVRWPDRSGAEGETRPVQHKPGEAFVVATAGLFRTPFGFEPPQNQLEAFFLERTTMSNAFFTSSPEDLGLRIRGGYRFFEYSLGLMNGDPIGERAFPGRDPNKSKDMMARVGVRVDASDRVFVQGGVSGLTGTGFHAGTPSTKDIIVWRDTNEDGLVETTEITSTGGSAATASQNFHRFALGADARVRVRLPVLGDLTVFGEIVRASNLDRGIEPADPVGPGRDLRELGWLVGFAQDITRWGVVGVRYDRYNPDVDASGQAGVVLVPRSRAYSTLAVMGGVRMPGDLIDGKQRYWGRLLVEYDHVDNSLGRSTNGEPARLADDALTVRAEVSF